MPLDFTFSDFLSQMSSARLAPIPRWLTRRLGLCDISQEELEAQLRRIRAIACAMTEWERAHAEQLDASRRHRIAAGSGVRIIEVSQLLRQFEMSRDMMRQIGSSGRRTPMTAVLGLVTNDPLNRDPSWGSPIPERQVWRRMQIAIVTAVLLVFAYAVLRHW